MDIRFTPREGAMRYQDDDGEWHCANPHDPIYSTVSMIATEFWSSRTGWVSIFTDTEGGDAE